MTRRVRLPDRRDGDTITVVAGDQPFDVVLGWRDPYGGRELAELFFWSRGKVGQGLDHILSDLGIGLSCGLQLEPAPAALLIPVAGATSDGGRLEVDVEARLYRDAEGRLTWLELEAPDAPGLGSILGELAQAITIELAAAPSGGFVQRRRQ